MNIKSITPNGRYKLLDAFRGVAILWIVVFHLLASKHDYYGFILSTIIKNGYLGVSIFFVVSGYGIAASCFNRSELPHTFLFRRLKRIYPCYWWSLLFAAFVIPILYASALVLKTHSFKISWNYSFIDWVQVLSLTKVFSSSSWKLNLAFDPYNGPIWYLAVIVQIYIFVAVCLIFKNYFLKLLYVGFIASLLANFQTIHKILPFGIFLPYFVEFYIGFAIYHLLKADTNSQQRWLMASALTLPLIFVFLYRPMLIRYLPLSCATITGVLIFLLYRFDTLLSKYLLIKILFVFGIFSYSLYLMHFPLRILGVMIVKILLPFMDKPTQPIAVTAVVIVLSFIWYLFFEKPSNQIGVIQRLLSPIKTTTLGFRSIWNTLKSESKAGSNGATIKI